MAHYDFYRESQADWGTPGFQGAPPPAPLYQPQPDWSGLDYYRAHSGVRDDNVFHYVFNKVRNLVTGTGVGLEHAIYWWKRVYGGLVDPSRLRARDLGAAAGYEAFRIWETHQGIYAAPLAEDREREREAIVSIAAAEATKLWVHTRGPSDKYGRLEASEVAAATAYRVFLDVYDSYEPYHRRPRSRRRSISASRYGVAGDIYDNNIQPGIVESHYPTRLRRGRPIYRSLSPSPYGRRSFSPSPYVASNNLAAPQPVRAYSRSPSPMSVASIAGSPVMDSGFASRRLRSPAPGGGYRSMTPMRYGSTSPVPWDTVNELALPDTRIGGPRAYGGGLGVGTGGLGYTAGVGTPGGIGMASSLTDPALAMLGANETNVTYDPVLGPGVRGTYYPKAASRTANLGASADMSTGMGYRALPEEYGMDGLGIQLGTGPGHYLSAPGTYGHRRGARSFGGLTGMGRRHRYGY